MITPLNSNTAFDFLGSKGISAADLYGRVSTSLLAQNAGVQKLTDALTRDQTRLSGLGQLQSALANFQALTQSVGGVGLQTGATASVPSVLTALTTGTAKAGTYAVDVKQLAQEQVLVSRAQKNQDTAIGSGATTKIMIEFGTTSGSNFAPGDTAKMITIDSSNNTLKGIEAELKKAGIDAKVVRDGNGYTLQLEGKSGAANSMRISVAGDADVQKLLAYNPNGVKNLTQASAAQDAILTIDGKKVTSASNVITGQIPGTALSLSATGATNVVVAQDNGAISKNVGNFVEGFNALADKLKSLRQGELKTDTAITQVQDQLAQLFKRDAGKLADVGITQDRNGALQIDSKVLKEAIAANPEAVSKLFTDNGKGIADQLSSKIGQLIGANGTINKQKVSIDRDITSLSDQKNRLTSVLTAQAQLLVSQYAQVSGDANSALPGMPGRSMSLFDFMA